MAIESRYMRQKIKYHLTTLRKFINTPHVFDEDKTDQYHSYVEIKVIEVCSLLRKLRDLGKLPDGILDETMIKVDRHSSNGPESQRAWVDIWKEYDFNSVSTEEVTLKDVLDMVIHSYVLQAIPNTDNYMEWVFINSDRTRFKGLYRLKLEDLIEKSLSVVDLYPNFFSARYDEDKQKWVHVRAIKSKVK